MGYENVGIVSWVREVADAYGDAANVVCVRRGLPVEEVERQCKRAQREGEVGHYRLAVLLADMATRGLHQLVGCASTVHFARARLGMSRRQARDLVAVGEALGELPLIDEAFRDGRIGWTKVRILCRVASPESEKAWLDVALALSSDALERRCAGAEKGRPPREDERGLPSVRLALRLKLDPLTYETWELAKKRSAEMAGEPVSEADVLSAVLRSWLAAESGEGGAAVCGATPFKVVIGLDRGGDGAWVATDDGPIAIERATAEAVACDASELLEVKADGGLDVDPDAKTPSTLRQRILARDGFRCVHCQSRLSVNVHHVVFRSHGGKTIPKNLVALCLRCHTLVHEGLLVVTGTAPRGLRFTDRHGSPTTTRVPRDEDTLRVRVDDVQSPTVRARRVALRSLFDLPAEVDGTWWREHAHHFTWSERRGTIVLSEGFSDSGGAGAPPLRVASTASTPAVGEATLAVGSGDERLPPIPDQRDGGGAECQILETTPSGPLGENAEDVQGRDGAGAPPAGSPHAREGVASDASNWTDAVVFASRADTAPTADRNRVGGPDQSGGGGAGAPRPEGLSAVIGQERVVRTLGRAAKASALRGHPFPHTLFAGGPGLGKTSLARALAADLGRPFHATSGPILTEPSVLVGLVTGLAPGAVLFIDEIHAMPRRVAEVLYEAMEDGTLSLPVVRGMQVSTLKLRIPPFTFVGATTDPDRLTAPLRARFGLVLDLEPYTDAELARIASRIAAIDAVALAGDAAVLLSRSAHGTPRELHRLLQRATDAAFSEGHRTVDLALARRTLDELGIDERGLGPVHRRILGALAPGRTLSLSRLASLLNLSPASLRDLHEPALLRQDLVTITPRGRRRSDLRRQ